MASLQLRQGVLGKRLAAHLLRRCTYNISPSRIDSFAGMTADAAVESLFTFPALQHPEGPLNRDNGDPWLTSNPTGAYNPPPVDGGHPESSVLLWHFNELMNDTSIRHKMVTFWQAIWVTAESNHWRIFDHLRLLQLFCVGNIRTLALKMTLDNRMLAYLDNRLNKRQAPNENYAREFLELFTILKGQQVATGNYTNFTEHDIQQAARVLTGFYDSWDYSHKDPDTGLAGSYVSMWHHDKGIKKFSTAFQNQEILGATSEADMLRELEDFVGMVFNQMETAKAYVRKLYRYFVSEKITFEIEQDIIQPLAQDLFSGGYELENVLKKLLKSQHFYDEDDSDNADEIIGGKIKSPLELFVSSINLFGCNGLSPLNASVQHYTDYQYYRILDWTMEFLGLPRDPSTVEGFPGFFKEPGYSNFWVDQSTIAFRYRLTDVLLNGKSLKYNITIPFKVNLMNFVNNNLQHQDYAVQLVNQFLEYTLPEMPTGDRYVYFLEKILGGLSPVNWMFEWKNYEDSGDDASVKIKIEELFKAVLKSPEFQTF